MKICWARALLFSVITVFGISAILTACGQQGPLYLPEDTEKAKKYNKKQKPTPPTKR
ncbi:hypothetical protein MNBD_GAMMA12-502 [hydrothermal vent metagenome]|uniref:Lipoprotein n=1 Tax=hydrothermal vent metagenome TaxID=652676 RepID=A0A3B0YBV6_9ZZZZ